jgi:hypothetical protein
MSPVDKMTLKKIVVVGVTALLLGIIASSSRADDDAFGEKLLNCFHPQDRHMNTSCMKLVDEDDVETAKRACDGTPLKIQTCSTDYRGGWINLPYHMQTEMRMKYTCTTKADGSVKVTSWVKILDTQDSKTSEPCMFESWNVANTSTRH